MLDQAWLNQLGEDELTRLYNDCRASAKTHARNRLFGLAAFWDLAAVQCCEAIARFYPHDLAPIEQLALDGCQPRVAPDLRG